MINIDEEDIDEETLEDRIFEKADYIGEVLTGERKIHFKLPKRTPQIKVRKIPQPSAINVFFNNIKKSISKYREMSLTRLIGMSILIILSISAIAFVGYLLLLLLTGLLKLGVIGLVGFSMIMCALSVSGVLLLASRYTRR